MIALRPHGGMAYHGAIANDLRRMHFVTSLSGSLKQSHANMVQFGRQRKALYTASLLIISTRAIWIYRFIAGYPEITDGGHCVSLAGHTFSQSRTQSDPQTGIVHEYEMRLNLSVSIPIYDRYRPPAGGRAKAIACL